MPDNQGTPLWMEHPFDAVWLAGAFLASTAVRISDMYFSSVFLLNYFDPEFFQVVAYLEAYERYSCKVEHCPLNQTPNACVAQKFISAP